MLRIVERLFGEGRVLRAGTAVGSAGYSVSVYRDWRTEGAEMVAGDFVIEGHLMLPAQELDALVGADHIVLQLEDGRWFDAYVTSADGAVTNVDGRPLQPAR